MNNITLEEFNKLTKEQQLQTMLELQNKNKSNDAELQILALVLSNTLTKKQLEFIFNADSNFFTENMNKSLKLCKEKFDSDLLISFTESEIKDVGTLSIIASTIQFKPNPSMLVEYMNQVTLDWTRNKFKELTDVSTVEKAVEEINKINNSVVSTIGAVKVVNFSEDIDCLFEYYDKGSTYLKTGFGTFDEWIKLEPSDFCIIAGQSGTGKTAFALNLIDSMIKNGNNGIFFSLEMTNIQIYRRMVSAKANITLNKLMDKENFDKMSTAEYQSFNKAISEIKNNKNLKLCFEAQALNHIVNLTKKEVAKRKIDFIVVDYIQLVNHKAKTEVERISEISLTLKRLAKELNIVVIGLSQLSRKKASVEDMTVLKGSSQLENDASQILILSNDETEEFSNTVVRVNANINKNRNGRLGKYELIFNKPMQQFVDRAATIRRLK